MDAVEVESLKSAADLLNKDLAGWQIMPCYYLELEHSLMGSFPAIRTQDNVIILVTDKALLKKVWDRLPPRSARINKLPKCLVHAETGITFLLGGQHFDWRNLYPLKIFSSTEIDCLDNINWRPGLRPCITNEGEISIPNFDS